jgi:K(+)-stimulated pyrophosphate-energized sodium pump
MREISELIYETCKTYLITFSLIGIAGSYGVAWFGIRVNTFANSRTAFAGLAASPIPSTPFRSSRHEHRHGADQRRAADHALHPALHPGDYAGPCFIGFAIGESLGAAALRVSPAASSPRSPTSAPT